MGSMVATGCRIDSNKHGDSDNVKIATPFGGMQVKTDQAACRAASACPTTPEQR